MAKRRTMPATIRVPEWVDAEMPYRGPCGICGASDARHRVLDAIADRIAASDHEEQVAEDYELSVWFVTKIGDEWDPDAAGGDRDA